MFTRWTWGDVALWVALLIILAVGMAAPGWASFFGTNLSLKRPGQRTLPERRVNHPDARCPAPLPMTEQRLAAGG